MSKSKISAICENMKGNYYNDNTYGELCCVPKTLRVYNYVMHSWYSYSCTNGEHGTYLSYDLMPATQPSFVGIKAIFTTKNILPPVCCPVESNSSELIDLVGAISANADVEL